MMTDEAIRMAIAQSVGWEPPKDCTRVPEHKWSSPLDGCCYDELPNFCNDLNAIHEVENDLRGKDWLEYQHQLRKITYRDFENGTGLDERLIRATARQRAEAYLKSKNLWKE